MPKFSGNMIAAEAVGNAFSDFFKKALESEQSIPEMRLKMEQLNQMKRANMLQDVQAPLQLQQLQGQTEHQGLANRDLRETLGRRPTLWGREDTTWQQGMEKYEYEKAARERALDMQRKLAEYATAHGGKINFSDPRTLSDISGILSQGDPAFMQDMAQTRLKEKPSREERYLRLQDVDPSQWSESDKDIVKRYRAGEDAVVDEKKALAEKHRADAAKARAVGKPGYLTTAQAMSAWTRLLSSAHNEVKTSLMSQWGFPDMSQIGDTATERALALRWFENEAKQKLLNDTPALRDFIKLPPNPMPKSLIKKIEEQNANSGDIKTDIWRSMKRFFKSQPEAPAANKRATFDPKTNTWKEEEEPPAQ